MCFHIRPFEFKASIATEDIVCYKEVNAFDEDTFKSAMQGFRYIRKELYTQEKFKKYAFFIRKVYRGFHSYSEIPLYKLSYTLDDIKKLNKTLGYYYYETIIVKCTIPKGSLYWKNCIYGEYVSNQLIIDEIVFN